jgi:hypothetical protein
MDFDERLGSSTTKEKKKTLSRQKTKETKEENS